MSDSEAVHVNVCVHYSFMSSLIGQKYQIKFFLQIFYQNGSALKLFILWVFFFTTTHLPEGCVPRKTDTWHGGTGSQNGANRDWRRRRWGATCHVGPAGVTPQVRRHVSCWACRRRALHAGALTCALARGALVRALTPSAPPQQLDSFFWCF